jgi:minor extracellular serine protease Vpr
VIRTRVGKPALRRYVPSRWLTVGIAIAAALSLTAVVGTAASGDETGGADVAKFARVDANLLAAAKGFVPAALSNKPVTVMLQLSGDPVAVQQVQAAKQGKHLSKAEKTAIRAQLKSRQDALTPSINSAGGTVVGQLQSAYNGVQVTLPQKSVSQLASLPGVVAVHSVRSFRPSNVHGVPYVGAPSAWGDFSRTGAGVSVAVIDTGVDYTHADFGGPGTTAAFDAANETSTAPPDPSLVGPGAPKVKGGTDFVGDDYNADSDTAADKVPHPDPNPLDCNGHGSHTAGTATGFGVLSDGSTYSGPYNGTTISSHDWNVGPGVAPQANLYAYRVFGCAGSSNVVDLAIDQAVADGVDVISMSLGSDFGGQDDPTTVAAENAAAAGIAVVASAGNAGSSGYIVGSPSTGDHVLSVAAIDASVPSYPGAKLNLSTGSSVDTIDANGAALPSGSFGVKVLKAPDGTIGLGCAPADYAGSAGKVVVTMRGTCARVARAVYGQQAGAAAVVMVNNSTAVPPFEGPITSNPDTGEHYTVTIPFLGAAGTPANTAALLAADGGTTTLSSITIANTGYKLIASFSSGGPRNPDSAPKPDVAAPGVSVASVGVGTGNGFAFISGTSMACPMTSGIAALVKQAHPSWNGAQVKAAIMNTADPSLNPGYQVRRAGTGVVQAQKAVNSSVLATTADGLDSIAFGHVPGSGDYTASKTITLSNTGASDATYGLSVAAEGSQRGAVVGVSPGSVTVPAGGTATVTTTLTIPSGAFAALPSNSSFVVGPGGVITVRGAIVATPTAGDASAQTLRVPYLVAPRGLSNVSVPSVTAKNGKVTATVTNTGIHSGNADVYAWGVHDDSGEPTAAGDAVDMRDVGVQVVDGKVLGGKAGDTGMNFLISNVNPSATQAINEYDVLIDTNGDGNADFDVFGADLGAVLSGTFNGQYASFIYDMNKGELVDAWYAEAPMNGSIVELPLLASEIGLVPGHARFVYAVQSFSLLNGSFDTTGTGVFDAHSMPVSSGDFVAVPAGGSTKITLTVNAGQQSQTPAKGWLFATVDDASGAAEADEVPLP